MPTGRANYCAEAAPGDENLGEDFEAPNVTVYVDKIIVKKKLPDELGLGITAASILVKEDVIDVEATDVT